jgi:hypothetical protein
MPIYADALSELGSWLNVASSAGFGALAWWLVVKQMPATQKEFSADMRDARVSYTSSLEVARADYLAQLRVERELYQEIAGKARDECDRRHADMTVRLGEVAKALREVHLTTRATNHAVNNIAQDRANELAMAPGRLTRLKRDGGGSGEKEGGS